MHNRNLHPGKQTLHHLLNQRFWILSSKRAISHVTSRCFRCWRLNPKFIQPMMGDLPKLQISQLKASSCVGVDYGGPFRITLGKYRRTNNKLQKIYIYISVYSFASPLKPFIWNSHLICPVKFFYDALRRFLGRRDNVPISFPIVEQILLVPQKKLRY